jgi:hypothetical protein
MGVRSKTTTHVRGSADPLVSSPKWPCQHVRIGRARRCYPDPNDVVPGCLKNGDRRAREIIAREGSAGNIFSELNASRHKRHAMMSSWVTPG